MSEHVYLGCHLSCAKGFLHMGKEAVSIGADTFQFFTRNPRGSRAKEIKEKDVESYLAYAAGYDIVGHLDDVLDEFDRVIGLNRLRAVHVNDSKNPFASHKDRHEKIGQGALGFDALYRIVHHPRLSHLPFCLETPNELPGYAGEIRMLRGI